MHMMLLNLFFPDTVYSYCFPLYPCGEELKPEVKTELMVTIGLDSRYGKSCTHKTQN